MGRIFSANAVIDVIGDTRSQNLIAMMLVLLTSAQRQTQHGLKFEVICYLDKGCIGEQPYPTSS